MAGKDQYMNFFTIEVTSSSNSANIAEESVPTGSGMATNLAWRIHKVEVFSDNTWTGYTSGSRQHWALSTRKGLSAIPGLDDKGTLCRFATTIQAFGTPANAYQFTQPLVQDFLPPMIIATPNLSFYFVTETNFAGAQNQVQKLRIGFTTEKLTESLYREVFETWNYAN